MPSQNRLLRTNRRAKIIVAIAVVFPAMNACDRLAGTNKENLALVKKHFDSLAAPDSNFLQRNASQDSLFAIREVQRRTDSILRLASPDLAPPIARPPSTGATVATAVPSTIPNSARGVTPSGTTAASTPSTTLDRAAAPLATSPNRPEVVTDVQRRLSRAQALGDSIANAQVTKMVGQNRSGAVSDTMRGVIQLTGTPPGARPVLMVDKGRTPVALTGMGIDGLDALAGIEVVVRGMKVSPRDIVVTGFSVRAVKGIPVLDGWLRRGDKGSWSLELSDKTGLRPLPGVPQEFQQAAGARIWIDAGNGNRPQTYGVIARR